MTVGVNLQGVGSSWVRPVASVPRTVLPDTGVISPRIGARGDSAPEIPVMKTYRPDGRAQATYQSDLSAGEALARGEQAVSNRRVEGSSKTGDKRAECKTCATRKYQDGSDDMGVSFQTPTHVSAAMSVAAVTSHEQEHVAREGQDAEEKGMQAISHVRVHMAKCPECGKMYAAGGVTETTKLPEKPKDTYLEGVGVYFDQAV